MTRAPVKHLRQCGLLSSGGPTGPEGSIYVIPTTAEIALGVWIAWSRGALSGVNHSFSSTTVIFPHRSLVVPTAGRLGAKPCAARRAARLGRSGEPACSGGFRPAPSIPNRAPDPTHFLFFVSPRFVIKLCAWIASRSDRWQVPRPTASPNLPLKSLWDAMITVQTHRSGSASRFFFACSMR